jgi:hypothetical protein
MKKAHYAEGRSPRVKAGGAGLLDLQAEIR